MIEKHTISLRGELLRREVVDYNTEKEITPLVNYYARALKEIEKVNSKEHFITSEGA